MLDFLINTAGAVGLGVASYYDVRTRHIPNMVTVSLIAFGFLANIMIDPVAGIQRSLLGLVVGAGMFLVIAALFAGMTGEVGIGGGDMKLMAAVGAMFGWETAVVTFAFTPIFGVIHSLYQAKVQGQLGPIAYAPSILLAFLVSILLGKHATSLLY